jgi:DNA-binding PadR family transcriptional regulator
MAAIEGKSAVYVTNEDQKKVEKEFKGIDIKLMTILPEELGKVLAGDSGLRVVVDASSINSSEYEQMGIHGKTFIQFIDHLQREKYLAEDHRSHIILCTYDMGKLTPELVKQLVVFHDKLMLTTSDATLLAAESLDRAAIPQEVVERFVKDELESIVLALLFKEPLCGTDIIKIIYNQFDVLLSPGTIYPLLRSLEKRELLRCEYGVKTKTYKPAKAAEEKIRIMLEEQAKASRFLSRFLQVAGVG